MQNRKTSALLAETRQTEERRDRELRAAALRVIAPMKSRPEPRTVWDEIARLERPSRRFDYTQHPMRCAVRAGADMERVVDFYLVLCADALSAAPQPVAFDLTTACVRAIKEQSEAIEAQAIAHATRCAADLDRAHVETREAIAHDEFYLGALRRARLTGRTF